MMRRSEGQGFMPLAVGVRQMQLVVVVSVMLAIAGTALIPLPAGAGLSAAGIDRRIADQYAAMAIGSRCELRRHVLADQGDIRSVDAISHRQRAAEIVAGFREAHRRARPECDIR